MWLSAHTSCGQHMAQPFMGRGVVQHPNLQTRTGRRCLWRLRLKLNVTCFLSPKNPLLETSRGGCHIGYQTWIEIEPGAFQPALRQQVWKTALAPIFVSKQPSPAPRQLRKHRRHATNFIAETAQKTIQVRSGQVSIEDDNGMREQRYNNSWQ